MSHHFDFLIDDLDRSFFQKVAEERADVAATRVARAPIEKRASTETPREKLAADIATDLVVLRDAGPIGCSLGMTKRALAHLGRLAGDPRVLEQPGVVPDLFNKVAAAALEADLGHAEAELCGLAPEEDRSEVRRELAKIARALVAGLDSIQQQLAKEAAGLGLAGLGRAAGMGRALRGAENAARGVVGAAEGGLSRMGRQWRARRALNARAEVGQVGKELEGTRAAGQALEANRGQMKPGAVAKAQGANQAVAAGQQQQLAKAQASYAARRSAAVAKSPAASARAPAAAPPKTPPAPATSSATPAPPAAPKTSPTVSAPTSSGRAQSTSPARAQAEARFKSLTKKPDSGGGAPSTGEAADKAKAAATPPEAGASGTSEKSEAGAGERVGAGKLTDTLHKFHGQGWGSLSQAEKHQLLTTGAGVIGAHRLLTGRDLLTGDKDD
jgi:hypothetical protein